MRFTKIRFNKKVELAWDSDGEQHVLASEGEPTPEFQKNIAAFEPVFRDVCALPKGAELQIHTITLSHDEDTGSRRLVVSATRTVSAGSYSVSTPHLQERTDLAKAPTHKNIPDSWLTLLDELEKQAAAYVKGERAQVAADLGTNGNGAKPKAEEQLEMPGAEPTEKPKRSTKQSRRTGRRDLD